MDKLDWRAPEYIYYEKDISWYWLVFIIGIIMIAVAVWQKNFLFVIFVVIAIGTLLAWGRRKPSMITIELTDAGITIDSKLYPKETFVDFSLVKGGGHWDKLILKSKSKLSRALIIFFPHNQFDTIKQCCLNFWTETEYQASLVDELSDFLKF